MCGCVPQALEPPVVMSQSATTSPHLSESDLRTCGAQSFTVRRGLHRSQQLYTCICRHSRTPGSPAAPHELPSYAFPARPFHGTLPQFLCQRPQVTQQCTVRLEQERLGELSFLTILAYRSAAPLGGGINHSQAPGIQARAGANELAGRSTLPRLSSTVCGRADREKSLKHTSSPFTPGASPTTRSSFVSPPSRLFAHMSHMPSRRSGGGLVSFWSR